MSAPALRERWFARRGGGAWAKGAFDEVPRRLRASRVAAIEDAQLLYGSGASIERSGRAPGFRDLRHEVWRERGFGDFWGYALVAEGAAEAMIEIGVNPWDLAAPEVVVEEAGGLMTDLDGAPRIDNKEVLATNGVMHEVFRARLRDEAASSS
jgi:histidinol-phosphatase